MDHCLPAYGLLSCKLYLSHFPLLGSSNNFSHFGGGLLLSFSSCIVGSSLFILGLFCCLVIASSGFIVILSLLVIHGSPPYISFIHLQFCWPFGTFIHFQCWDQLLNRAISLLVAAGWKFPTRKKKSSTHRLHRAVSQMLWFQRFPKFMSYEISIIGFWK